MLMLINIIETITNESRSEFLLTVSLISVMFGIFTVTTKNPVVSVLFLIGLFISISLHLILLGLYFIGLSYLLVYVGAVSILFLFILMLINVRISELLTEGKNSAPLALITVLVFNLAAENIIPYSMRISDIFIIYYTYITSYLYEMLSFYISILSFNFNLNNLIIKQTATIDVGNVTSKSWDASLVESNHITSIGNLLYTNLFILLIITSLILLLAMVGTIVITMKRKTNLAN